MALTRALRRATKAAVLPLGVSTRRRADDSVILLYHRVGDSDREIDMPVATFARQLESLAERGSVITLADAARGRSGGVVLTFDDGYADFHRCVVPTLVRFGLPATLYLATGLVRGESAAPANGEALTWTQLAEAVATGLVNVGSHTHTHADLSHAPREVVEEEMRRSKDLIEHHLGTSCVDFAYPWAVGSAEADAAARSIFETAALDAWRTNRAEAIDPFRLGRTPVLRSDGLGFFRAKAGGYLDGEALIYRALGRGPWGRP
jgi:peptidoglycan/xylan/chitin deacetylase (PgdA/CDA1 family)